MMLPMRLIGFQLTKLNVVLQQLPIVGKVFTPLTYVCGSLVDKERPCFTAIPNLVAMVTNCQD